MLLDHMLDTPNSDQMMDLTTSSTDHSTDSTMNSTVAQDLALLEDWLED